MKEHNLFIPGLERGVKPRNSKSERLLSLVPMFARGQFFFRSEDIAAQQEFLSYPKGKHDDIMDAVWTALEGARPASKRKFIGEDDDDSYKNKFLDWLTM
jgi:phage terminase large subunit-like protein